MLRWHSAAMKRFYALATLLVNVTNSWALSVAVFLQTQKSNPRLQLLPATSNFGGFSHSKELTNNRRAVGSGGALQLP